MRRTIALLLGGCILTSIPGCVREEKTEVGAQLASEAQISKYKDGTYSVETKPDHEGYFTKAEVHIEKGRITSIDWNIFDTNREDRIFDETYEEVFAGNERYKQQCRDDLKGAKTYSSKLVETQDIDAVDAVTGATWTNLKFKEAAQLALNEAEGEK